MRDRKQRGDTPKLDRDDSLKVQVKSHPFTFKESPNNPLNERIVEAINRMGGVGEDAEANYQSALDALCRKSKEVVSIAAGEYRSLPKEQYLDRWSLVQLLAELKDPSSLPYLDEILSSQIPSEESTDPHGFTTVGEEVMIRTTVVEAVTRIAADGNSRALELLLKHARHENFSVKRASIQGYLVHGGANAREALLKALPERDHHILHIRSRDVREVPQAQGGLFLVSRDKDSLPPPQIPKERQNQG